MRGVPYDRPLTTMAGFPMCALCQAEYDDPADRRFHAQPNACPTCGPGVSLASGTTRRRPGQPSRAVALQAGGIVAVKGIGGFHLACVAADERAVAELRARKHREEKPFALMARDLEAADELVRARDARGGAAARRDRPIVLAPRRPGARVAAAVAPLAPELGVMLPYSPLHHLLLADLGEPLVMTSGNVSDEPIAYEDDDALERLGGIADAFVLHDRPIETRTDDSVLRVARGRPLPLRRSRGAVPSVLALPVPADRHVLACGAELKSTFCLARGRRAWVSHHIGDLKNAETLGSFEPASRTSSGCSRSRRRSSRTTCTRTTCRPPTRWPARASSASPSSTTTRTWPPAWPSTARPARRSGAIFDGAGLGTDGTVWGGEILVGDLRRLRARRAPVAGRAARRRPGGARAVADGVRLACGGRGRRAAAARRRRGALARRSRGSPRPAWRRRPRRRSGACSTPSPRCAGCAWRCPTRGRRRWSSRRPATAPSAAPTRCGRSPGVLDARETILAVDRDVSRGVPTGTIAARFHHALADATAAECAQLAADRGLEIVVLSGGAFQNRRLLERTAGALEKAGVRVLVPERLPPNDGGISYGQAAVAAARASGAR